MAFRGSAPVNVYSHMGGGEDRPPYGEDRLKPEYIVRTTNAVEFEATFIFSKGNIWKMYHFAGRLGLFIALMMLYFKVGYHRLTPLWNQVQGHLMYKRDC